MAYKFYLSPMKNIDIINERIKIGKAISEKRKIKNISQSKLNRITGLSSKIIRSIERGTANYTIDSYIRYLNGIGENIILQ